MCFASQQKRAGFHLLGIFSGRAVGRVCRCGGALGIALRVTVFVNTSAKRNCSSAPSALGWMLSSLQLTLAALCSGLSLFGQVGGNRQPEALHFGVSWLCPGSCSWRPGLVPAAQQLSSPHTQLIFFPPSAPSAILSLGSLRAAHSSLGFLFLSPHLWAAGEVSAPPAQPWQCGASSHVLLRAGQGGRAMVGPRKEDLCSAELWGRQLLCCQTPVWDGWSCQRFQCF